MAFPVRQAQASWGREYLHGLTGFIRKKLAAETEAWERTSNVMTRVLAMEPEN